MTSILDFLNSFTIEYLKSDGQRGGNIQFLTVIDSANFNDPHSLCCNHGKYLQVTHVNDRKTERIYFSNPMSD